MFNFLTLYCPDIRYHVRIWTDSLLLPSYFACLSILFVVLHLIYNLKPVKTAVSRLFSIKHAADEDPGPHTWPSPAAAGLWDELCQHAKTLGGGDIFAFRVIRFISCLVLLALSIVYSVLEKQEDLPSQFQSFSKSLGKSHDYRGNGSHLLFTRREWLHVAVTLVYVSAFVYPIPYKL